MPCACFGYTYLSCLGFIFLILTMLSKSQEESLPFPFSKENVFRNLSLGSGYLDVGFPFLYQVPVSHISYHIFLFLSFFLKDCSMFFSFFKHFLMSGNVFNFQALFLFLIIPSSLHPFLIFMAAMFALRILFRNGCLLFLSF